MITRKKLLTVAVSTSLAGALLATNTVLAADASLDAAASVLGVTSEKAAEGKCGEGKCGGDKKKEGKCGEGKCGGDKKKEGKCGEGKCGGNK